MTETVHTAHTRLKTLHKVARLCIPVVVLAFVFQRVDWSEFVHVFARTNPWLVCLGIAYCPVVILFGALRWRSLVARLLHRAVPLRFMLTHYWIGLALGMFAPASIGWDVYRVVVTGKRYGHYAGNVAAILVEKVMALLNAVLMVLLLYPWIHGLTEGDQPVLRQLLQGAITLLAAGLGAGLLVLFTWRNRMALLVRKMARQLVLRITARSLAAIGQRPPESLQRFSFTGLFLPLAAPRALAIVLSLSLAIQLTGAVGSQIIFRAVGYDIPLLVNVFLAPVFTLIFLLPISFGGLGIREGAYIVLYGLFGVPPETALLVSFLNLAGILLNNGIGATLMWLQPLDVSLSAGGGVDGD